MADIVLGVGTSHSPLLILADDKWSLRGADDRRNKALNTLDGRLISYDELVAERGEPFGRDADPAGFPALARRAEQALDRLAAALIAARPDVLLVVGDDQGELFRHDNLPAISIFHGDEIVMKDVDFLDGGEDYPDWATKEFYAGYRMDMPHRYPAARGLATQLIEGLIDRDVDIASANTVLDPTSRGFGHAFGFVIQRLMRDLPVPMLPVLLNTYFPPNAPRAARCHEIGRKIADTLAASPDPARVAVLASGGLSHFLCEETLDRRLLEAFRTHDAAVFTDLPQKALLSGSSEIRNWITVAGMVRHMRCDFSEYIPVRRTPAGTGIGLAFMTWVP